jgi:hypothetical protein
MTDPAPRHRTPTRWRALALLAAAAVLLAGCELATGTVRTASELQRAGIRDPNLRYDGGVATLDYDADPDPLAARAEQDRAAAIIWRNLPFRIERIAVTSRGGGFPTRRDYPRALLERQLGPRPAGLDRSVTDIARRASLIAAAVALVLLVLIVVVIVLVVRAVRRRPAAQPAGPWPQGGWGQPGWGQPGWGQPAPPAQQPWGAQGPGQGQPVPGWPPQQPPPAPPPAGDDWPSGAPRPGGGPGPPPPWPPPPPARGPGDTQRLEPGPAGEAEGGPTPPP